MKGTYIKHFASTAKRDSPRPKGPRMGKNRHDSVRKGLETLEI